MNRLTLMLTLLLGGLSQAGAQELNVVVSLHPHFDLVRQLAGERATVTRVLPLGASPHTFEPTPQDVVAIAEADVIVMNGGLDEWLLDLVDASGTDAEVLELLSVLPFEPITGEEHEHEGEGEAHEEEVPEEGGHDHEAGVNPHVWTDPQLMAAAVPLLVEALSAADPEGAATYEANGEVLEQDLAALDADLAGLLTPVQDAPFIPYHDAWPYFVRRYGLNQVAVLEPAPGREPSPSYLADVLGTIADTGATALFTDVQLPARPAELVAAESGVPLYTLDPEGGGFGDESYQALMRRNAETIAEGLSQ